MKRRQFLKTAVLGGVAAAVGTPTARLQAASLATARPSQADDLPDLVAVMGGEPEVLYARAISEMGGMGRYVKPGMKVVVKPNIGWDKSPEFAANTNPVLVAAIVRDCLAAGAAQVTVFDHSCDNGPDSYRSSGIEAAAKEAGAQVANAFEEKYFKEVNLPLAVKMKTAKIHEALVECDVWINVPILKNHGGAKMTVCMKNYMGVVWDRRYLHTHDLQQCIADAATYEKRPVLNIVDAYRIMTQNGPKGKSVEDVQTPKALFISRDIVAADTAAVQFFNQFKEMPLASVKHISYAQAAQLGTMNLESLNIKRIKL